MLNYDRMSGLASYPYSRVMESLSLQSTTWLRVQRLTGVTASDNYPHLMTKLSCMTIDGRAQTVSIR